MILVPGNSSYVNTVLEELYLNSFILSLVSIRRIMASQCILKVVQWMGCCIESPWVSRFLVRLILKHLSFTTISNLLILKYFFDIIFNMADTSSVN